MKKIHSLFYHNEVFKKYTVFFVKIVESHKHSCLNKQFIIIQSENGVLILANWSVHNNILTKLSRPSYLICFCENSLFNLLIYSFIIQINSQACFILGITKDMLLWVLTNIRNSPQCISFQWDILYMLGIMICIDRSECWNILLIHQILHICWGTCIFYHYVCTWHPINLKQCIMGGPW